MLPPCCSGAITIQHPTDFRACGTNFASVQHFIHQLAPHNAMRDCAVVKLAK